MLLWWLLLFKFKIPELYLPFGHVERVWFVNFGGGVGGSISMVFSSGREWRLYEQKDNHKQIGGGGRGRGDELLWKKNKFWYTGNEGFVEIYWRNTHAPISCLVIYFLFYCDSFCIDISHDSGSKLSIRYKNLSNLLYMLLSLL